ncbi:hypothetical protein [Candidatus Nitrospira neomarina]|uniref:Uncharacterized protein n=1 Tax=Candidatus Nitrospira neomarina TaxID=3020899 RepID=A0AA96GPE7_9BACT|nr:hypothetical protein [Candidatus Nitrospira neomarina]WNM61226.1 hypothetical protein PQG83_15905 [Candidatus Nitrospira neomarina]
MEKGGVNTTTPNFKAGRFLLCHKVIFQAGLLSLRRIQKGVRTDEGNGVWRKRMKSCLGVLVLVLGVMGMVSNASSDIVRRTDRLFFAEPIPCHVYLKRKQSVESSPSYVPGSFFQVKVELLRMEPDVIRIKQVKIYIQGQMDRVGMQQHPEYAERLASALKSKEIEDRYKVLVLHVLETLEGPSPGEEIVISVDFRGIRGYQAMIAGKAKLYVLGYQGTDRKIYGITVDTQDLYERNDWFLTTLKQWVRWLLSECDNV